MSEYMDLNSLLFYQEISEACENVTPAPQKIIHNGYLWNVIEIKDGVAKLESPYDALVFNKKLQRIEVPINKLNLDV